MKTKTLLERTIGFFARSRRSLVICLLLTLLTFAASAQLVSWSDGFTQGVTPTLVQCNSWSNFLNSLTAPSYASARISGSANPTGISITDPVAATQLANLLRTRTVGTVTSGGHTWSVGLGCGGACATPAVELSVDFTVQCQCSGNATIRPQIGNSNWGGVGTVTCGAPTQVMTLEFVVGGTAPPIPPGSGGRVLLLYADIAAWAAEVRAKLVATGTFTAVDLFDGTSGVPSAALLANYNAILVWTDNPFSNPAATGDALVQYINNTGGGVVNAVFSTGGLAIGGAFNTAPYWVIQPGTHTAGARQTLGTVFQPTHPIMQGVTSFDGGSNSYRGNTNILTAGSVRIANWTDGLPLIAVKENVGSRLARRADVNFFPPSTDSRSDFWVAGTSGARIMANALLWAGGGVRSITTGTILPGTFCSNTNISVPFTVSGLFNSGNVFTAQLSNASGSFSSFTNIGGIMGTGSGTINAFIPNGLPSGTGYRIRVVSSNPAVTGTDNGSNLTINARPTATLNAGLAAICAGQSTNLTIQLTGTAPWSVTYLANGTPTTVGASASPLIVPVSPPSSTTYFLAAVNDANCSGSVSGDLTVLVNTAPVITVPLIDTVENLAGLCGQRVEFVATATGSPPPTISYDIEGTSIHSPHIFPVGATIVTATATNVCGSDSDIFVVVVLDTESPLVLTPPDTTAVNDEGACSAILSLPDPVSSDNCAIASITNDQSGQEFPVGETIVTWTITDIYDNFTTVTQTVTVVDTEAPSITSPPDVIRSNDEGLCSGTVVLVPPATFDNCEIADVVSDQDDNVFPVGETIVTWTATDIHGNSSTATQKVTIRDLEAPVIATPEDVTVSNDAGLCSATVLLTPPVATDNCDVVFPTNDQVDDIFPVGETIVTWNVVDANDNTVVVTQRVIVNDTEAPSITVAADVSISNLPDSCSALVLLIPPTTSDNCAVATVAHDQTDDIYPVGVTTVTWTVTDIHGNSSTATQTVTVNDTQAPSITAAADLSVSSDAGLCSATVVLVDPTTFDNCGVASVSNDQADNIFPVGETIVTWTVTDIHGNSSTATQKVTVADTEAPSIIVTDVSVTNDPGLCSATVTLVAPSVSDNCGVATVSNDHPGNVFPEGVTNVTWTVTDNQGNVASEVQHVTVVNGPPVIISLTPSSTNVAVNTPVSVTTTFTDNNVTSASINWGDGSALQSIASPANPFTASHSYSAAGTYQVIVTLTDACNASASFTSQSITVNAPANTGCVIGAGWFNSRPGAYQTHSKTGKASFAFVATFVRGIPQPIGATLFNFHAGNLLFTSLTYQSLVISGHKAFLKGSGKINGISGYQFLISVVDGDLVTPHTTDKFRIKISNMAGTVIYDNQRGAPDDAEATTSLAGGEIIINNRPAAHAPAPSAHQVSSTPFGAKESTSSAFPNPFTKSVTVKFETQNRSKLHIEVMGVTGVPAYSQDHEFREDGTYEVNMNDDNARTGVYFLKINQGPRVEYIKLLRQ